jgi:hypothetical protein
MARIQWDQVGTRYYENGVDHAVLYLVNSSGAYDNGVAWNGLTSVSESPSGADANKLWADNMNYLTLYGIEEFGASIEAYTYPDEFAECDGSRTLIPGVTIGQQTRKGFGLSYRTKIGNDTVGNDFGYKLHLIYGCRASPSDRSYETINDSPDAITFSWEITTTPVEVVIGTGDNAVTYQPTASLIIDSRDFTTEALKTKLTALENVLYGTNPTTGTTGGTVARLPLPAEVITILS